MIRSKVVVVAVAVVMLEMVVEIIIITSPRQ